MYVSHSSRSIFWNSKEGARARVSSVSVCSLARTRVEMTPVLHYSLELLHITETAFMRLKKFQRLSWSCIRPPQGIQVNLGEKSDTIIIAKIRNVKKDKTLNFRFIRNKDHKTSRQLKKLKTEERNINTVWGSDRTLNWETHKWNQINMRISSVNLIITRTCPCHKEIIHEYKLIHQSRWKDFIKINTLKKNADIILSRAKTIIILCNFSIILFDNVVEMTWLYIISAPIQEWLSDWR